MVQNIHASIYSLEYWYSLKKLRINNEGFVKCVHFHPQEELERSFEHVVSNVNLALINLTYRLKGAAERGTSECKVVQLLKSGITKSILLQSYLESCSD